MRWRWSGTMNLIGNGVVIADTEDEALRQAKNDLYINGAPDCDISVEPRRGRRRGPMVKSEIAIFDGVTFDTEIDGPRLTGQLDNVRNLLLAHRGEFFTISEIHSVAGGSESGVSARIRDLRKAPNGGHDVQRRRRAGGLWEYGIPKETA